MAGHCCKVGGHHSFATRPTSAGNSSSTAQSFRMYPSWNSYTVSEIKAAAGTTLLKIRDYVYNIQYMIMGRFLRNAWNWVCKTLFLPSLKQQISTNEPNVQSNISIFQSNLTKVCQPNNDAKMCIVVCPHASCIPFTQWSSRLLSAEIIFGPLRLLQVRVRTVWFFLEADGDHLEPPEPSKTFRNHSKTGRADFSPPAKQLQTNWTPVAALALAATATAAGLPERATFTHKQFFSNVQSQ